MQNVTRLTVWLALLTLPLMAFAGGLGIAPFGFAVGVAAFLSVLAKPDLRFELKPYLWAGFLIAALIWANITASWSPYETTGWTDAHTMLLMTAGLIFVPTAYRAMRESEIFKLQHVFMATSFLIVGLMLCDVLSGWGLSLLFDPPQTGERLGDRQNDSLMNVGHGLFNYVPYTALIIGMSFALIKRSLAWLAALGFTLTLAVACRVNLLDIGPLALIAMAIFMGIASWRPKVVVKVSIILFALAIFAAPLLGIVSDMILKMDGITLPESYEHRLRMWAYCWAEIKTHPFIGAGFDASRTYQDSYVGQAGYDIVIVSLHPHNIGLQVWLEIGAIGAALLTLTIFALWPHAMRYVSTRPRAAALSGFLIGSAIIAATSVGVWQFWWWASFALGLLILRLIPEENDLELAPEPL